MELCTGDPEIIVAVLDEGVMWKHPDLEANMWVNESEVLGSDDDADKNGYKGDRYGYNFVKIAGSSVGKQPKILVTALMWRER